MVLITKQRKMKYKIPCKCFICGAEGHLCKIEFISDMPLGGQVNMLLCSAHLSELEHKIAVFKEDNND